MSTLPLASFPIEPAYGETGRSALRKASLRLVPLIAFGYCAAFIDRVNISFAAPTMNRDLHFTASTYGLGAGLFFVSYAVCEIPSNALLVRFGARRWLARIMLTWGLLAMSMMFVRTPRQFYAVRFLLGMAEAGFFPGVVFYLTEWFPPEYRARTISRFYIALPLASTVMGSLAGALLGLNGRFSLTGWQWLFLVEGLPPLVLSYFFWRNLPDRPADAAWLEPEERTWLEDRLAVAASTTKSGHGAADLLKVIIDVRIWLVGLFFLCMLSVGYGWTFSAPVILRSLTGWSIGRVGGWIAALGLLGALAMLVNASHSDRCGERFLHIGLPCVMTSAGFAAGALSHSPLLALTAFGLAFTAYNALQGPMLIMPAAFFSGRASAIGYATMNTIGMSGGFIGPYWMGRARDFTGNYQRGLVTLAILPLIAAGLLFLLSRKRSSVTA